MVSLEKHQLMIDGKPELIISGEIHYFRLQKGQWQDRIEKLVGAGMNAVATYIPWLCHEEAQGEFDFGSQRENLDIEGFIELCEKNGLFVIARPGPFIMAEMKNEGIPYWVAEKYPHLVPVGWEGKKTLTSTLDYLAEDFLACVDRWYGQIMPILARHLVTKGGNVIACQLDNEIGMLSWVSNSPDLTDVTIPDFERFLKESYEEEELRNRYPFLALPYEDRKVRYQRPEDAYALAFHRDLGNYMRGRYARYAEILKATAKKYGVEGVPFLINVHGTGGGRGYTFPVGISQLLESFGRDQELWAGTDIYFSGVSLENLQDIYLTNCYMEAVNRWGNPLASFEFQSGEADYGETGAGRLDVSDADFTARIYMAQGARLLNHYLFAGGYNMLLKYPRKDGNRRIAITGERHGFSAPVNPEGRLSYTYPRISRNTRVMLANAGKLGRMQEERDDLLTGFIPDYFMTEYCYPGSAAERRFVDHLTRWRTGGGWDVFTKALLLNNFSFGGVNLQEDGSWMRERRVLYVLSASFMGEDVQRRLCTFLENGGSLLLYGRLPEMDMEGRPCRVLADFIGVRCVGEVTQEELPCLSVQPVGIWQGYAEVRIGEAQLYEASQSEPFLQLSVKGGVCAFLKKAGKGMAAVIGTDYICNRPAIRKLMERLGAVPRLRHDEEYGGIFLDMSAEGDEKYLHILNLDSFAKRFHLWYNGQDLLEGRELWLGAREGLMLPINLTVAGKRILYATSEIIGVLPIGLVFRLTQEQDVIVFEGAGFLKEDPFYHLEEKNGRTYLYSAVDGRAGEKELTVVW